MDEEARRYKDALWFVIGATRQAAVTPNRWERACRLSEAIATEALGMPSLLENAEHHRAPDFTEDERRQNKAWAREEPGAAGLPRGR